jgi:hypothetical protein
MGNIHYVAHHCHSIQKGKKGNNKKKEKKKKEKEKKEECSSLHHTMTLYI